MFSVIFDMDGTLLDTQKICIPAWDYAGEQQGYANLGSLIPSVCGMNEAGWNRVLLKHNPDIDTARFNSDARAFCAKYRVIKPMPGMYEILDFLKENNIKTAVASGSKTTSIIRNLTLLNALEYFDAVIGGEEVQNGKPAPDIFLLASERLGATPETCFVFEDSPNGIIAASRAGMRCIGIPDLVQFDEKIKSLLTAESESLDKAIPLLESYL